MGGAQGFLLPELGSHFFHGSRAASQVCRAPRTSTALASSQRVVATELGGRLPGSGLPLRCAPAQLSAVQQQQPQPCRSSHCHSS